MMGYNIHNPAAIAAIVILLLVAVLVRARAFLTRGTSRGATTRSDRRLNTPVASVPLSSNHHSPAGFMFGEQTTARTTPLVKLTTLELTALKLFTTFVQSTPPRHSVTLLQHTPHTISIHAMMASRAATLATLPEALSISCWPPFPPHTAPIPAGIISLFDAQLQRSEAGINIPAGSNSRTCRSNRRDFNLVTAVLFTLPMRTTIILSDLALGPIEVSIQRMSQHSLMGLGPWNSRLSTLFPNVTDPLVQDHTHPSLRDTRELFHYPHQLLRPSRPSFSTAFLDFATLPITAPSKSAMSDDIHDLAAFASIVIFLVTLAVGWALIRVPRHPHHEMVPRARRQLNTPAVAIPPSGARLQRPNPRLAYPPQPHQLVHPEGPVAALAPPSPPPNYLEYLLDTRIDGAVPSYTINGSSRGSTVNVVPPQNHNPPPPENANVDEGGEGGHV
ncbi:hypothetical protein M407DRAFT_19465 [Tulasnella calospora MUT 4182]|uniref:Uncharacterized protein n=1 Tax=Tulasnella calospora MUT 4182 TaxID=1051891 RepID=A0A0C3LC80_9AGAM|nr:hypothetical protein M407DRAFT_19465 [Tulasnella calospora MUT 4182]